MDFLYCLFGHRKQAVIKHANEDTALIQNFICTRKHRNLQCRDKHSFYCQNYNIYANWLPNKSEVFLTIFTVCVKSEYMNGVFLSGTEKACLTHAFSHIFDYFWLLTQSMIGLLTGRKISSGISSGAKKRRSSTSSGWMVNVPE